MVVKKASKWGKKFWSDLAERVGSTAVGAALAALTVVQSTPVDWSDAKVVWGIIGVPSLVSLLKGLGANLATGDDPSASLVAVSSDKVGEQAPLADEPAEDPGVEDHED